MYTLSMNKRYEWIVRCPPTARRPDPRGAGEREPGGDREEARPRGLLDGRTPTGQREGVAAPTE